ncbi:MAG: hypothetical protein WC869_15305 [Phycisphaerae bacterium]
MARTVSHIRQAKATDALIARQEFSRPSVFRPTFSVREIGAVAAAVLVMAVIFLPSVQKARQQASVARCASQQAGIGSAFLRYANDNGGSLPSATAGQARWLNPGQGAVSNSSGLFKLVNLNYVAPGAFQCPAVSNGSPAAFSVQAGMSDFPANKYISYSYQHTLGHGLSINDPGLAGVSKEMAILADSNPLFSRGNFQPSRLRSPESDNHGRSGQNVLYLDAHVNWSDKPTAGVAGNNIYLAEGVYDYRGDETPVNNRDSFLLPAYSGR